MFKSGFPSPCSQIQYKHSGSQGQSSYCLPQVLGSEVQSTWKSLLMWFFQHSLIVSLGNRLVEPVTQLLCCLLSLSGAKHYSQASCFVQEMQRGNNNLSCFAQNQWQSNFSLPVRRCFGGRQKLFASLCGPPCPKAFCNTKCDLIKSELAQKRKLRYLCQSWYCGGQTA